MSSNGERGTCDEATNTVIITSIVVFSQVLKNASQGIFAFDRLDAGQGENALYRYGDGSEAQFDAILAAGSEYDEETLQKIAYAMRF